VLVVYRSRRVLEALQNLNIDIPPNLKIIDASILSKTDNTKSLDVNDVIKKLTTDLNLPAVPTRYIRSSADNMANLVMRMFLMLSCKEFEKMGGLTEYQNGRKATLKSIARDPIQEKLTLFTPDRLVLIREYEIRRAEFQTKLQEEIAKKGTKKIKSDDDWSDNLGGIEFELAEE